TEIRFRKFCGDRVKSYDDLKPSALKQRIIEHFLPTLHEFKRQERDLKIEIELETAESNEQREFLSGVETVTYSDLPELNSVMIDDSTLDVYDKIEMFYHISVGGGKGSQLIAVNIDGRTIPINLIQPSSVPPDCSIIFLFSSSLFAARADSARQRLVLPDGLPEAELFKVLRTYVGNILEENIPQIEERNEETAVKFENDFPHLLGYFEQSTVGLINKDEALCIAQQKFFHEQKRILQCETFVRCFI
ncbi:MAG: ATP-binding protein, partial [Opitutales bacterium]